MPKEEIAATYLPLSEILSDANESISGTKDGPEFDVDDADGNGEKIHKNRRKFWRIAANGMWKFGGSII
jgi:hypothetical protein